ncbi:MAG: hypothetical protein K0R39_1346 [Symbiobacteriaceae bacterium]|jgi:hypothetical protein|nr:hypothetical protein [Symbiobacteriaceae bacterium]
MRRLMTGSPWVAAAISWLLATGLVSGGYTLWLLKSGKPTDWTILRDAALMAAPLALFRAWRDARDRR